MGNQFCSPEDLDSNVNNKDNSFHPLAAAIFGVSLPTNKTLVQDDHDATMSSSLEIFDTLHVRPKYVVLAESILDIILAMKYAQQKELSFTIGNTKYHNTNGNNNNNNNDNNGNKNYDDDSHYHHNGSHHSFHSGSKKPTVEGGVLVDLTQYMNQVRINCDDEKNNYTIPTSVTVQAGATWGQVYQALEDYQKREMTQVQFAPKQQKNNNINKARTRLKKNNSSSNSNPLTHSHINNNDGPNLLVVGGPPQDLVGIDCVVHPLNRTYGFTSDNRNLLAMTVITASGKILRLKQPNPIHNKKSKNNNQNNIQHSNGNGHSNKNDTNNDDNKNNEDNNNNYNDDDDNNDDDEEEEENPSNNDISTSNSSSAENELWWALTGGKYCSRSIGFVIQYTFKIHVVTPRKSSSDTIGTMNHNCILTIGELTWHNPDRFQQAICTLDNAGMPNELCLNAMWDKPQPKQDSSSLSNNNNNNNNNITKRTMSIYYLGSPPQCRSILKDILGPQLWNPSLHFVDTLQPKHRIVNNSMFFTLPTTMPLTNTSTIPMKLSCVFSPLSLTPMTMEMLELILDNAPFDSRIYWNHIGGKVSNNNSSSSSTTMSSLMAPSSSQLYPGNSEVTTTTTTTSTTLGPSAFYWRTGEYIVTVETASSNKDLSPLWISSAQRDLLPFALQQRATFDCTGPIKLYNWQSRMHGNNYSKLQSIKRLHDPKDFFHVMDYYSIEPSSDEMKK